MANIILSSLVLQAFVRKGVLAVVARLGEVAKRQGTGSPNFMRHPYPGNEGSDRGVGDDTPSGVLSGAGRLRRLVGAVSVAWPTSRIPAR